MKKYHYTPADFSTKSAAQETFRRLVEPLKRFYSDGGARLDIGVTSAHYEDDTVPMEAFARVLWGLAPYFAGGGRDKELEDIVRRGLDAGSDPGSEEYWHTCRDFDQKFCEMPAIGFAMLIAPDIFWEPLSEDAKTRLVDWLWEINRHECCACNWQWFCILTNVALKSVGREWSRERVESGLAMLESYYYGGGWYRDGDDGDMDYYNAYVMLPFGLLYAKYMEDADPERCRVFRERAREFAGEFINWFSDDGPSIAFGRSMTYRFAQTAFFSMALLAGEEVLPVGVMKGVIARHLAAWLNMPIFDNAGVLTIGYGYPNIQMAECYNAPGSPYWALMAFAFLALPDDHPFWLSECAPLPELPPLTYLRYAGMLVQRGKCGVVVLTPGHFHASGHGHMREKYGKFAYSSRFAFSVARGDSSVSEFAPDSSLAFEVDGHVYTKDVTESATVTADGVEMDWSPLPGIRVHTTITPTSFGHIRSHIVESEREGAAYDCGFAVPEGEEDSCKVRSLSGGEAQVLYPAPNTNLIATKTAIPMAAYELKKGKQAWMTRVDYL